MSETIHTPAPEQLPAEMPQIPVPEGSILGLTPRGPINYDNGYPCYENSKVHYETHDLAMAIAQEGRLIRYTRTRLAGRASSFREDAAQSALLGFLDRYQEGPPLNLIDNDNVYKLFYGIVAHKVADTYRKLAKLGAREQLVDEVNDIILPAREDVAAQAIANADRSPLIQILRSRLSPASRTVLDNYLANPDLQQKERAEQLGTTEGAYRVATHRMFRRLQTILVEEYEWLREGGVAEEELYFRPLLAVGRENRRAKRQQVSPQRLRDRFHKTIRDEYMNGEYEVGVNVPAYLGPWAVGALDLKKYLDLKQSYANVAVVTPNKTQFDALKQYLSPLLGEYADNATFFTPDTVETISRGRFDYVLTPPLHEAAQAKLRLHANFILYLSQGDHKGTMPYLEAPGYEAAQSNLVWDRKDSLRYIRELYFALGRAPTQTELAHLRETKQGPSVHTITKGFKNLDDLAQKALATF